MKKQITLLFTTILLATPLFASTQSIISPVAEKSPAIKGIVFFKKAEGLSYKEFLHQWRDLHAPMVHLFHFDGYVQNSKLPKQLTGMHSPFDGVLNVWFHNQGAKDKTYASPFWSIVARDEPALLKSSSLKSLSVDEYIILDGPLEAAHNYAKLIIATKKNASINISDFIKFWLSQHAFDVVSIMAGHEGLVRYTMSTVNGLSIQQKDYDSETSDEGRYAVIEELWFKKASLMKQALSSKEWHQQQLQSRQYLDDQDTMIVEEFIGIKPESY